MNKLLSIMLCLVLVSPIAAGTKSKKKSKKIKEVAEASSPVNMTLSLDGKNIVTINAYGQISFWPGYTPDAAALVFWTAVLETHPYKGMFKQVAVKYTSVSQNLQRALATVRILRQENAKLKFQVAKAAKKKKKKRKKSKKK